mmetsp:Transcript_27227/g.89340  ORF Transcript_27227/g.89340 Transcript_27227/m.89340 type:complete len:261 (-) Transcript_27227:195-977(-)
MGRSSASRARELQPARVWLLVVPLVHRHPLIAEEARRHVLPQLATRRLVRVARHGGRTREGDRGAVAAGDDGGDGKVGAAPLGEGRVRKGVRRAEAADVKDKGEQVRELAPPEAVAAHSARAARPPLVARVVEEPQQRAVHAALDVLHPPDPPPLPDQRRRRPALRAVVCRVVDQEGEALVALGRRRRRRQAQRLLRVGRHRLLHEHVQARPQPGDSELKVRSVRRADEQAIQPERRRERVGERAEDGAAVTLSERCGAL